jgi:hypothetical protein
VIDVIKDVVGVTLFFEKYKEARDLITSKREERKAEQAFEAAVNPERAIKKMNRKRQKKKVAKKRKLEVYKATKNPIKVPKLSVE